jgi:uncharacterized cupin superfamily protein
MTPGGNPDLSDYNYGTISSQVHTLDLPKDDREPDGAPTSLAGRVDPRHRVHHQAPKDLEKKTMASDKQDVSERQLSKRGTTENGFGVDEVGVAVIIHGEEPEEENNKGFEMLDESDVGKEQASDAEDDGGKEGLVIGRRASRRTKTRAEADKDIVSPHTIYEEHQVAKDLEPLKLTPHHPLSTSSSVKVSPYLFRASDNTPEIRTHPLDDTVRRHQLSLGDPCGLTQLGVHLCRLPPNNISTLVHWHSMEDEWFYIIKASEDARILIHEVEQDNVTREKEIQTGDFLGFPAGTKIGHGFKSGESELIYLMGGSREQLDVVHYPAAGKRLVIDRTDGSRSWTVEEKYVKESPIVAKVE